MVQRLGRALVDLRLQEGFDLPRGNFDEAKLPDFGPNWMFPDRADRTPKPGGLGEISVDPPRDELVDRPTAGIPRRTLDAEPDALFATLEIDGETAGLSLRVRLTRDLTPPSLSVLVSKVPAAVLAEG